MTAIRQIYENLPKAIKAPIALKNWRVEVIMLPLDEATVKLEKQKKVRRQKKESYRRNYRRMGRRASCTPGSGDIRNQKI